MEYSNKIQLMKDVWSTKRKPWNVIHELFVWSYLYYLVLT